MDLSSVYTQSLGELSFSHRSTYRWLPVLTSSPGHSAELQTRAYSCLLYRSTYLSNRLLKLTKPLQIFPLETCSSLSSSSQKTTTPFFQLFRQNILKSDSNEPSFSLITRPEHQQSLLALVKYLQNPTTPPHWPPQHCGASRLGDCRGLLASALAHSLCSQHRMIPSKHTLRSVYSINTYYYMPSTVPNT